MASYFGRYPANTYGGLLNIDNSNLGIDATLRTVQDGKGNLAPIQLSTSYVNITALKYNGNIISTTGALTFGGAFTTNGAVTFSGAFSTTLTVTNTTSVTLPTSGTLYGTATGSITSAQLATSMSDETGSGSIVFATSPTLVTPVLGAATATSINKMAITAPATSSTIAVADGKTLTASNTLTLAGTDSTTITFQGTDTYVGRTTTDTLTNKTLTSPKIGTSILDTSGNNLISINSTASAATYIILSNATANNPPSINVGGTGAATAGLSLTTLVSLPYDSLNSAKAKLRINDSSQYVQQTVTSLTASRAVTWPDTDINTFVVQRVSTVTGAMSTGTTVTTANDTIPQNTSGDQYMSLAITPKNSNNILKIEVTTFSAASGSGTVTAALFQDSTAGALACMAHTNPVNSFTNVKFTHVMTAGTTSSTTFKVRLGAASAGTLTFNGSGGARFYGGALVSSIIITEYSS